MHDSKISDVTSKLPSVSEMLSGYLQGQFKVLESGLTGASVINEVQPFEAVPVQPVDPKMAWEEAQSAALLLGPKIVAKEWNPPADWASLVRGHEPVLALAYCVGNFPQMVRDYQRLLHTKDDTTSRPESVHRQDALSAVAEAEAALHKQQFGPFFAAVATLRLAKQFEVAAELLDRFRPKIPAEWNAVLQNEIAALAWHQGNREKAVALWAAQPETAVALFNRGMASLFANQPVEARSFLSRAIAQIPETSAWHHLAKLYRTLAEMR